MQETQKTQMLSRCKKSIVFTLAFICVAVILALIAKYVISVPCVFYKLTGFQCPGCGNTRAAIAILSLDFKKAFGYNAFCFLEFFYLGWIYVFSVINYIKNNSLSYHSPSKILDIIVVVLVVAWGVVRNII